MSQLPAGLVTALAGRYSLEREVGEGGMATVLGSRSSSGWCRRGGSDGDVEYLATGRSFKQSSMEAVIRALNEHGVRFLVADGLDQSDVLGRSPSPGGHLRR